HAQLVFVIRLQDGVVPDVDILVERDVFGMENEHARLENDGRGAAFELRPLELAGAVRARGHPAILDYPGSACKKTSLHHEVAMQVTVSEISPVEKKVAVE